MQIWEFIILIILLSPIEYLYFKALNKSNKKDEKK